MRWGYKESTPTQPQSVHSATIWQGTVERGIHWFFFFIQPCVLWRQLSYLAVQNKVEKTLVQKKRATGSQQWDSCESLPKNMKVQHIWKFKVRGQTCLQQHCNQGLVPRHVSVNLSWREPNKQVRCDYFVLLDLEISDVLLFDTSWNTPNIKDGACRGACSSYFWN